MFKERALELEEDPTIYWKEGKHKGHFKAARVLELLVSYTLVFFLCIGSILVYDSVFPIGSPLRLLFLCIGIVEILLFFVYLFVPLRRFAPLLAGCGFLLFFLFRKDSVISGLKQCANEVILKFNAHFGSQFLVFQDAEEDIIKQTAIYFLALLFLWWFVEALFHLKNVTLLSMPPLILICGELLVGRAPEEIPLLITTGAFFALLSFGCGRHIKAGNGMAGVRWKAACILAAAAVSVLLAAARYGRESAESIVKMQDEVLSYQFALEKQISEYAPRWLTGQRSGQISNKQPKYEEKEVISVTSNRMPAQNVYLRGYVGDTYRNGNWTNRSQMEFEDKISDKLSAADQTQAGSYILNLFYQTQLSVLSAGRSKYTIRYLDTEEDYAYLPYMTNLEHVSKNGRTVGPLLLNADAMIYREGADTLYLEVITPYEILRDALIGTEYRENRAIESCYSGYLSQYLRVPKGLPGIRELGNTLRQRLASEYKGIAETASIVETAQIQAASLVREALFQRADYSLELDRLPFGEDVVEYFLFDSGKGFCEHYASAGVLLLRMMGIPARYVSGYVIKPGEFVRQSDTEYTAVVMDSAAHAWAEVFIEHVGWVPVEMTEGRAYAASGYENYGTDYYAERSGLANRKEEDGNGSKSNQDKRQEEQTTAEPEKGNRQEELEQKEESEEIRPEESGERTPSKKEDTDIRKEPDGNPKKDREQDNGAGAAGAQKRKSFMLIFAAIVAFAGAFGTFWFVKQRRRQQERFMQKSNRRAVEEISAALNRFLQRKGILKRKGLDDKDYRNALKNGLPMIEEEELSAYFLVLEKTAYSNEKTEKEDVDRCYQLYKKIRERV